LAFLAAKNVASAQSANDLIGPWQDINPRTREFFIAATRRRLGRHASRNGRRVVSAFIATAFAQDDAEAAKRQWRRVAGRLRPKLPKLAAFMDEDEPEVPPT
jgi:transposase-like protein